MPMPIAAGLTSLDIPPSTPPKDPVSLKYNSNPPTPLLRRPSFFQSLFRRASNPPPPPPKYQDQDGQYSPRTRPSRLNLKLWPRVDPHSSNTPLQSPATLSSAPSNSKVQDDATNTSPTIVANGNGDREESPKTVEAEWRAESRSLGEGFKECLLGAMCIAITDPTADLTDDVLRSTVKNDSNEKRNPLRRSRPRSPPPPLFDSIYVPLPDPVRPPPHRHSQVSHSLRDSPDLCHPPGAGLDEHEQFANHGQRYPEPCHQQLRQSSYQRRRTAQAPSLETIHSQSLTRNSQNSEDINRWVQSTSVTSRANVSFATSTRVSQEEGPERKVANSIERSITLDSVSVTLGCSDERQLIRPRIARQKAIHRVESKLSAVSNSSNDIRQDARRLVNNLREAERLNPTPSPSFANAVWGDPRIPRLTREQFLQVAASSAIGSSASLPTNLGRSTGTNSVGGGSGSSEEEYRIRRRKEFKPNRYPNSRIKPQDPRTGHALRANQSAPMLGYHTPEDEIRRHEHIQQYAESPAPRTAWVVVPAPPRGRSPTPSNDQLPQDAGDGRGRRRRKLEGVV